MFPKADRRAIWSWAFYDWGNSAFATTIMAGFFPVFFKKYYSAGADVHTSTLQLGVANSIGSLLVAAMAPILGAVADRSQRKKKMLIFFAYIGALASMGLGLIAEGEWALAVAVYALGTVGFSGANIFFDSLLIAVAPRNRWDFVSGLGFAMGYLGGGLLFALNVAMTLKPEFFGLAGKAEAIQWSFYSVGVWWIVFSFPLIFWVDEPVTPESRGDMPFMEAARLGLGQVRSTFGKLKQYKPVIVFLVAYWLYIDGVDTIIRMSVDYGMSLGFSSEHLIAALLITQFVGFPAALAMGKAGEVYGPKKMLFVCLAVYGVVTCYAYFLDEIAEFYIVALVIGLVMGGVQALSRSYYARIIPVNYAAEFFGFYNMWGKFAAVFGPFLIGITSYWSGDTRMSILSVLLLFIGGAILLAKVDAPEHPPV